jgi:hypothetical protein
VIPKEFNAFRNMLLSNWCRLVVEMRAVFKQQNKIKVRAALQFGVY